MLDGHARARPISAETFASAAQMAVRIATAIEQRLTVMLKVAEQALDAHPTRSTRRCSSGHGLRSLANLRQMALRAGAGDALCLVS